MPSSTFGVLAMMSRKYAHKIPFVVKINHNEFLSMPASYDQIMFGSVEEAWNLRAVAVGNPPSISNQKRAIARSWK